MSYFGNVSSFPCLEFTAAFSRNQALFDVRNDFPLFPQSTASHFGHFAETFPISPGIPAIRTRPRPNAHVIGSRCALTWPPLGIPSGHNPFPLAPTPGELAAKPTERAKSPSPPPAPLPEGEARLSSGTAYAENPGAAGHRGSVIFGSGSPPGRWSRCPGRY